MDTEAKQETEASSMSLQGIYYKLSSVVDIDTSLDMTMPYNRRVKTCNEIVNITWYIWNPDHLTYTRIFLSILVLFA